MAGLDIACTIIGLALVGSGSYGIINPLHSKSDTTIKCRTTISSTLVITTSKHTHIC